MDDWKEEVGAVQLKQPEILHFSLDLGLGSRRTVDCAAAPMDDEGGGRGGAI